MKFQGILLVLMMLCTDLFPQVYSTNDNYFKRGKTSYESKRYKDAGINFERYIRNEGSNVHESRQIKLVTAHIYAGSSFSKANVTDKVIPLYEQGIELARRYKDDEGLSILLNNIALEYQRIGKFEEALSSNKEALAIDTNNKKWKSVAIDHGNIGLAYQRWGDYEQALQHFIKSKDIHRELGDGYKVALRDQSIGELYLSWGELDQAKDYLNRALSVIKSASGNPASIQVSLADIAIRNGQYDEASRLVDEAMNYDKQFEDEQSLASHLLVKGKLDMRTNEHNWAIATFEEALAYARFHEEYKVASEVLVEMGHYYLMKNNLEQAIASFSEAIEISEKLRANAHGPIRREFLASQIEVYKHLTQCYFRTGDYENALATIERSRGKYLAEQMEHTSDVRQPGLTEIQSGLAKDEAVLVYANADWRDKILLVITAEELRGYAINDESFLRKASSLDQQFASIKQNNQRGFLKIVEPQKETLNAGNSSDDAVKDDEFELSINLYRHYLTEQMDERTLGRYFRELLIQPADGLISKKNKLIIVPDGILNYLPFEALHDGKSYLVEDHSVKYVQSMTIWEFLKTRQYADSRKFMLAFGGAVYNQDSYKADMGITTAGFLPEEDFTAPMKLGSIPMPIYGNIPVAAQTNFNSVNAKIEQAKDGSMRELYNDIGVQKFDNLPGTLNEVNMIQKLNSDVKVYTGYTASEKNLKKEARSGELSNYKVLHLATHGLTLPKVPRLSAVVMSLFEPERLEDGYLRTDEIHALGLNADFVNLSACETGLGKIYGGEGVVGLTQSFLIAGANALSVSLWSVADNSTSTFMVELYKYVINKNMTYSEAMAEVKRQFISGKQNKNWSKPYYWAPFVYYGR